MIRLIGTPQASGITNGNSVTLTFSVAPQDGDLVLVAGGHFNRLAATPSTSGYTQIVSQSAADPSMYVGYKIMGSAPNTTFVGNGTGNAQDAIGWCAYVFRGVDLVTPQDATATTASGASGQPDAPSITTVTGAAHVVALAISRFDDASPGTPADYGNDAVGSATDTNRISVYGVSRYAPSAGAYDPGSWFGATSAAWYAVTVALRPAVGVHDISLNNYATVGAGSGMSVAL